MRPNQQYPITIFWSDEDEAYVAFAPDLPGCIAVGETQTQAVVEMQDAMGAWLDAAASVGNPIPPATVPVMPDFSTR